LRPIPEGVGRRTVAGSRAAARVTTLYRHGVLAGKGASLIEGYMEDLATDRIYRLMLAQRVRHRDRVEILDEAGRPVEHTPELVSRLYDEELEKILSGAGRAGDPALYRRARRESEQMIVNGWHDPL
jgi:malate synthase